MPIIDRSITSQPSVAGTIMAVLLAVDGVGIGWRRSRSRFADVAAAQAASLAFNWDPQLRNLEDQRAEEFIADGGDPEVFGATLTEMSLADYRKRQLKKFAKSNLADMGNDYMLNLAAWVADMTVAQIEAILSISTARAGKIKTRAIRVRDEIKPEILLDRADVDTENID